MKATWLRELKAMAEEEGMDLYDHEVTGSGHLRLLMRKDGVERFYICAKTPSDNRNAKNVQAGMRNTFKAGVR